MIHIWLPNPQAPLRVWQPTTQSWQTAENWQEVATLASLQSGGKIGTKSALKASKHQQVCLYFPSLNLLKVQPNLPTNQLKALGEAGRRYLFEDISLGSVEDLQVKIDNSPMPSLYALHQSDREQWERAISLAGLELVALLPDFVLLPIENLPPTRPSELQPNELQPSDLEQGTAVNVLYYQDPATQLISYALPTAQLIATPKSPTLKQGKPAKSIQTLTPTGEAVAYLPLWLEHFAKAEHMQLQQVFINSQPNPVPDLLSQIASQSPLINLQDVNQNENFAPRALPEPSRNFYNFAVKKSEAKIPRYLQTLMAVLLATWLVNLAVDGLRWYYYQKAAAQTQTAIATQYNQWFPAERMNPRLSLERQLQSKLQPTASADDSLLPAMATIQSTLQQYQITAKNLNYQAKNLQLDVTAKDNEALNKAVTQLTNQGINAKLGNVANNAGITVGQLQIGL